MIPGEEPKVTSLEPAESRAAILIDFDNWYESSEPEISATLLSEQIGIWVHLVVQTANEVSRLDVRLYGGWYQDFEMTHRASLVAQSLGRVGGFPTPHPVRKGQLLHGQVGLATELLALPTLTWGHTRRLKLGLPRLRLHTVPFPEKCVAHDSRCPVRNLYRFTKHRRKCCPVDDCPVLNKDAFKTVEQKMVDALLMCDLLTTAIFSSFRVIVVASNDSDMIPCMAMVASRAKTSSLLWARDPERTICEYDEQLTDLGIRIVNLQSGSRSDGY